MIQPCEDSVAIQNDPETPHPYGKFLRIGTVLAVGPGYWNHRHLKRNPMPCKVGDRVVYRSFNGNNAIDLVPAMNVIGIVPTSVPEPTLQEAFEEYTQPNIPPKE